MSESQMKVTVKGTRLFEMPLSSHLFDQAIATKAREPARKRFAEVLRQAA
ncbi:hypothetical protein [Bradyrhizobium acaciae]|nr:hypothetical protein [Bradyrhizobium acaciae]MCC8980395.1 hypothetical protein [Bradyrhizobium acaciae]